MATGATVLTMMILLGVAGCGRDQPAAGGVADERKRDSVIGASQLPGAQGVRGALRVSDSADARRVREDSAGH
ncbi:MAG: hypothetical protein ACREL3_02740 [Gemmatimonadales bacterium]